MIPAFAALAVAGAAVLPTAAYAQARGGNGGGGGGDGGANDTSTASGSTGSAGGAGVSAGSGGGGGGAGSIGGSGGSGFGGAAGGVGGTTFQPQGGRGADATTNGRGGGGGGGAFANNLALPLGAQLSSFESASGGAGGNGLGTGSGGGGGAGGFRLFNVSGSGVLNVGQNILRRGGAGGAGGNGGVAGNGGNGGDGGSPAIVFGPGGGAVQTTMSSGASLIGGAGGNGGSGVVAGRGGRGGDGLVQTGGGFVTNFGLIQGGNGGTGSVHGAGGIGLIGADIVLSNFGTISGGLSGDGVTRALALRLSGNNTITDIGTLTGGIEITSGTTTLDLASDETLASLRSGGGAIVKDGTGNLTLTAGRASDGGPSGSVTINAGTLTIAASGVLSRDNVFLNGGVLRSNVNASENFVRINPGTDATISTAAGTTLEFTSSIGIIGNDTNPTIARFGTVNDTGTILTTSIDARSAFRIIVQGGTLQSGGLTSLTSNALSTQVDAGALLNNQGTFGTNPDLTIRSLSGGGTVRNNGGTTTILAGDFGGVLDGTQNVRIGTGADPASVILTGTNSYSGTTTISSQGTLQIGNGGTTGTLGGGSVTNNGDLIFDRSDDFVVANIISGTGGLTKRGAGLLTLTGSNAYSGTTKVEVGTLRISNSSALGSTAAGTVVSNGATLELSGGFSLAEAITINGNGVGGVGALRTTNSAATILSSAITLGSAATINAEAGMLLTGGITGSNHNLTVDGTRDVVVNSAITLGTGKLIQNNSASLRLVRANSYSGGTDINAGTVQIFNIGALGSGLVTLNGGNLGSSVTGTLTNEFLVTAGTDATISAAAGRTLTLDETLTVQTGDPRTQLRFGTTSDTGTVVVRSSAVEFLAGVNDFDIVVQGGTLADADSGVAFLTYWANSTQVDSGALLDFRGLRQFQQQHRNAQSDRHRHGAQQWRHDPAARRKLRRRAGWEPEPRDLPVFHRPRHSDRQQHLHRHHDDPFRQHAADRQWRDERHAGHRGGDERGHADFRPVGYLQGAEHDHPDERRDNGGARRRDGCGVRWDQCCHRANAAFSNTAFGRR